MYAIFDNGIKVKGSMRIKENQAVKAYFDYVVQENYRLNICLVNLETGELVF